MLTFQQIGDAAADELQDDSTATRTLLDRSINQGAQRFGAVLNREVRVERRTFSTAVDQRNYQTPENCIRIKSIVITIGNQDYPLTEISDDEEWNDLLARDSSSSDRPEFWHAEGQDLFGIWPKPASIATGLLRYESRMSRMAALDYITGTIAVTNGSAAIVGTSTVWTAAMVGRTLLVTDSTSEDSIPYKIVAFTDTTHITVENVYGGVTGSAKTYRIGQMPDIPPEFHESLVDYALMRAYNKRRDRGIRKDMETAFKDALELCAETYSSMSSSQYTRARRPSPRAGFYYRSKDYRVQ
jgi:hypothetical protein